MAKRHTRTGLHRLRAGHTRWKVVLYEPGQTGDPRNQDQAVAYVCACTVTRVQGISVSYDTPGPGWYTAGIDCFLRITQPTFRAAMREARQQLKAWQEKSWRELYGRSAEAGPA